MRARGLARFLRRALRSERTGVLVTEGGALVLGIGGAPSIVVAGPALPERKRPSASEPHGRVTM